MIFSSAYFLYVESSLLAQEKCILGTTTLRLATVLQGHAKAGNKAFLP